MAGGVGGSWYWNRYPGARCDVASLDYSYSFDPELEQDWVWTERYAAQPEILRYANHVADRYDLWPDLQFDTRILGARYDEATQLWSVTTDRGERTTATNLILASGCLSAAKEPDIPGHDSFAGWQYRTSSWPHEGVDFSGQRVGVIGTGSSAIQAIPIIAEQASELTVFQRTPNFSMPARNRPLSQAETAAHKADYRRHRKLARESVFGLSDEPERPVPALSVSAEERHAAYRAGWDAGSLVGVLRSYNDLLVDPEANDTAGDYLRAKIRAMVDDPAVAESLSPTDHPFGSKRPCLDTDYYATFNRDNVRLVDLRRAPLTKITPGGIDTTEGHIDLDTLVHATGFDAVTGAITRMDIVGREGRGLAEVWADGPRTYLGLTVHGFPNLFTITGPGSPSVLSNLMVSIEQHVEWITDCMIHLRQRGMTTIEPTADAEADWIDHVRDLAEATLLPEADSWYLGANVAGKPRAFLPYVGGVGRYRRRCDAVAVAGYDGFDLR